MLVPSPDKAEAHPIAYALTRRGGFCDAMVLTASVLFLVGSVFFLPSYYAKVDLTVTLCIFLGGCLAFTFALPVYALVASSYGEAVMVIGFFVSILPFDIGVVLLFPEVVKSLGQSGHQAGEILFAIGCGALVIQGALFLGGSIYDLRQSRVTCATMTYEQVSLLSRASGAFMASVLFLWGSLDFFSDDPHTASVQSAILFISGSVIWLVIALTPYVDAIIEQKLAQRRRQVEAGAASTVDEPLTARLASSADRNYGSAPSKTDVL